MKSSIIYTTESGQVFNSIEDAISSDHDELCEEINEVIKSATVKDYFVPHKYTCELVLAFAPMPKIEKHGIDPVSTKACKTKVENLIAHLERYKNSLQFIIDLDEGREEE